MFMHKLPRNMALKAFDPHRKEFPCNYEKYSETPLNEEAETWFREGLAATSFDLWPDDRDYVKAAKLWSKSAEEKHWQAMLNLASLYIQGKGVGKDTERAVSLVEEVMKMGIPRAFDFMGTLHINGTGVRQDATRAYAFWSLAAEMGSADAQAYLGERLNASRDDPARETWGNKALAYKLMECAHAQENGRAASILGLSLGLDGDQQRALNILHDGVKFGSEKSAIFLAVSFRAGDATAQHQVDQDRGDRYGAIAHLLRLNPDLRLPNLDKVLPLPPAILPYWDGDKQTLIDGAKPVKTASLADIKPSPASLRQGRAHIPDGLVLPDEPQGGHLIQHLHTDAIISGFWLAQLAKPYTPKQVAWNAAQVPMYYALGESFTPPEDITKESGVLRFHYLGTPIPKSLAERHVPDWRVPQGVLREVPVPSRELRSSGLLPAPATGIWHGTIDPAHPLSKVFNLWTRQAYVEEGQSFPDPRERGLEISPKDIQWQWLDQANLPLPSGRKDIIIRNFSPAVSTN
ncbi:TPR repeat containing, SEL1 subfamily, protein [Herbaspirillum seropedicae SmR1]|uniref:TPR repeat containing, SEL1 subfamily, protein n=2 Tax=Herbaspirillum seropedicae TaxID=964 RepID=D8IV53_HERSS|nr:TPR repeat containing, SEL1 subfamily, protein [Herbaspirillum seropedicae SmR1]